MEFGVELKSARDVVLKFQEFPEDARAQLVLAMQRLAETLKGRVQEREPERTGELRSNTRSRVYDDASKIAGRVFVAGDFSERSKRGSVWGGQVAALEYGAHSVAVVRAHSARLDHVYDRLITPITVMHGSYQRRVNIAEVAFLRGPLAAMASEAVDELRGAITKAAEMNS